VLEELVSQQNAELESKVQVLKDNLAIAVAGIGPKAKIGSGPVLKKQNSDDSAKRVLSMVENEDANAPAVAIDNDEMLEKIAELVEMCTNFEDIANYRSIVPKDMPSALCLEIASCSQGCAAFIASLADRMAIQKIIRGNPSDISYEDPVVDKRVTLQDQFLSELRNKLNENNPGAGALRLEARDMFMTRFNHALQLALSKHDQVRSFCLQCRTMLDISIVGPCHKQLQAWEAENTELHCV
jgi:hypothetical protein